MAQYCDHGGYPEHRIGDGECLLCEHIADMRKALAAAEEMRYELGRWRNHSQADMGPDDACDAFDAAMAEVRKGEG